MNKYFDIQPAELANRLSSSQNLIPPWPAPDSGGLRKAAVLIPFQRIDNQWHILFTRRTDQVQDHKGQVSFPGGAKDLGDKNEIENALRETYEEIGVHPEEVTVLGRLGEIPTLSNYLISPIVAIIPYPYSFMPSTDEVSRIFTIPLEWLADPSNHIEKQRTLSAGNSSKVLYFNEYDGELLWGITAYITETLIQQIFG